MIYYFSATGNTLAMARKVAEATGDSICSITRVQEETLTDPVIGLFFPVFYGDIPANFRAFLDGHRFPKDAYIYAVGTCGSSFSACFQTIQQHLQPQGCHLAYSFIAPLVANSTICMRAHVPYKRENLDREDSYVKTIAAAVKNRQEDHQLEKTSWLKNALMVNPLSQAIGSWYMHIQIDPKRCTKCGECVRLCPVENIHMGEDSAVMEDHCLHCLSCLHGCPFQVITVRGRVVLKEDQWRHPGVTVKELER